MLAFRRDSFAPVAAIPVGKLPHGIWPSGDGSRVYVGLENDDAMVAIDTASNKVIATIPIGQAAQAVNYVPNAVPTGSGTAGLVPLGVAANVTRIMLGAPGQQGKMPTSVSLFDQGLVQILEAAVTGLEPKTAYVLGLAETADGSGAFEGLASFTTNPAGAAVVNSTGPIRSLVRGTQPSRRRFLVIVPAAAGASGKPVQVQRDR